MAAYTPSTSISWPPSGSATCTSCRSRSMPGSTDVTRHRSRRSGSCRSCSTGSGVAGPDPRAPVISTVVGRYYAMDRDKRWERTKIAYDAMVHGVGEPAPDPLAAIRAAYEAGETDEFVKPRIIAGTPRIRSGDGVFCFNFRADRM